MEFFGGALTLRVGRAIDSKTRVLESGWVEAGEREALSGAHEACGSKKEELNFQKPAEE